MHWPPMQTQTCGKSTSFYQFHQRHAVAVILVHHARKGAGNIRAGQALRGSSEFHAGATQTSISGATATIA